MPGTKVPYGDKSWSCQICRREWWLFFPIVTAQDCGHKGRMEENEEAGELFLLVSGRIKNWTTSLVFILSS